MNVDGLYKLKKTIDRSDRSYNLYTLVKERINLTVMKPHSTALKGCFNIVYQSYWIGLSISLKKSSRSVQNGRGTIVLISYIGYYMRRKANEENMLI